MTTSPLTRRAAAAAAWLLRCAAIAYLLVVLGMLRIERWLVYPAPSPAAGEWAPPGEDYQDAWIEVPAVAPGTEPTRIHGWFFDLAAAGEAVLYCHGNAEDVSELPEVARRLRDAVGAAVLVWDYRGYGKSEGKPFEAGVVADGLAAQRWLAERTGRRPEDVVLIGRSIGGGIATALAAEQGASALVLQSTFTSLPDAAAHRYPWLPVRWGMHNRYDSLARIAGFRGPVLVSHGTADEVVPFDQGRRLFEAAPGPFKRFVEFPGKGHNAPQPRSYDDDLRRFLADRRDAS